MDESSFFTVFTIMAVLVGIVFVVVIGAIIVRGSQAVAQRARDDASAQLSVPASVVGRRQEITGGGETMTRTTHYATFQLSDGQRMELKVPGDQYGMLAEGDRGQLTYQGSRYQGFQRSITPQDA